MTSQPLISVVIPTYERVKLTLAAVNSVLKQDYSNYEIIVVDDGSTQSVLTELKESLPANVKLLSLPHSSLPAVARNAGVAEAQGEWIAFLDSDDLWSNNKLTIQVKALIEGGFDCVSADFTTDSSALSQEEDFRITKVEINSLLRRNTIVNSSVVVRKTCLETVGGISSVHNVRGVEDYATWLRLLSLYSWGHINSELGTYVTSHSEENRISNSSNPFNHFYAIIDFLGWLRSRGYSLFLIRLLLKLIPRSIRN